MSSGVSMPRWGEGGEFVSSEGREGCAFVGGKKCSRGAGGGLEW